MLTGLALGLVFGSALFVAIRSFAAPARVSLTDGLARLHEDRAIDTVTSRRPLERLTDAATGSVLAKRVLTPMRADIGVAGLTEAGFLSDLVARAGAGLIMGSGLAYGVNRINGLAPLAIGGFVLFFTVIGGLSTVLDVRDKAKVRRREFLEAMVAFIEFVRLGSTFRPLEGSTVAGVRVGDGWPFEVLAVAMEDSRRYGEPIWFGLGRLGRQYGLPDLEELANTLALGHAEGANLTSTLSARSRALRVRLLANELAEANKATETLQAPVTMFAVLFFFFLAFPAALVLTGNG